MTLYRSRSGKISGVTAYEIGEDYITVRFGRFKTYRYTALLNGQSTINKMKLLALASNGLSTFIAKHKRSLKFV